VGRDSPALNANYRGRKSCWGWERLFIPR